MTDPVLIATHDHRSYSPASVASAKRRLQVTVCIPAHNEASTIGRIVTAIRDELMIAAPVVDELIVIEDGSDDATASEAIAAGAAVVRATGSVPGRPTGKGGAMTTGAARAAGDIVVFLDGDITDFQSHFVTGLVGPLLANPRLAMTKAAYRRACNGVPGEGGRVNALLARPLLARCFPELGALEQPLAGECAVRSDVLRSIDLAPGYGVEIAMLIDIARTFSPAAIAQVDLGARTHRNRPLDELTPHATDVLNAVLDRADTYAASAAPGLGRLARGERRAGDLEGAQPLAVTR